MFKLTQTTAVTEYQTQFELLSNRVIGLPHNFLLSCFISGLKPHIKREVQALQPLNLMQAVDFAKLHEETFSELRKFSRFTSSPNTYSNPHQFVSNPSSSSHYHPYQTPLIF